MENIVRARGMHRKLLEDQAKLQVRVPARPKTHTHTNHHSQHKFTHNRPFQNAVHRNIQCQADLQKAVKANDMKEVR